MDFRSHASSSLPPRPGCLVWSRLFQRPGERKASQSFFLDIFSSANLLNGRCNHSFFFLLNDPLRGGTNDSGKRERRSGGGQEGAWWETQASDPWTSSSDTGDLCIIQDGDSQGHKSLLHILHDVMAHIIHIIPRIFWSFFPPEYNRVLSAPEYLITIDKCGKSRICQGWSQQHLTQSTCPSSN